MPQSYAVLILQCSIRVMEKAAEITKLCPSFTIYKYKLVCLYSKYVVNVMPLFITPKREKEIHYRITFKSMNIGSWILFFPSLFSLQFYCKHSE